MGTMCKGRLFIVIYEFDLSCKKYNNACTLVTNCFCTHSSVILVFISLVASQLGKKHQNDPLVSAETVRHSSTYIILYILTTTHSTAVKKEE